MEDEKCKRCLMNDNNKQELLKFYAEKIRKKPNAIQIISLMLSCFTLGFVIAKSIFK